MISAKILSVMLKSSLREGFHLYKLSVIQQKALWINRISTQTPNEKKKEIKKVFLTYKQILSNSNSSSVTCPAAVAQADILRRKFISTLLLTQIPVQVSNTWFCKTGMSITQYKNYDPRSEHFLQSQLGKSILLDFLVKSFSRISSDLLYTPDILANLKVIIMEDKRCETGL